MQRFRQVFGPNKCAVVGMIHVGALPGTPKYKANFANIVESARYEANLYARHKLDAVLIENMHDIPYVQNRSIGPETIACMARLATEIKTILPLNMPCGIQILACGNKQALSVAKACDLQFIRAEGFVFGHLADEGYTDACAGDLLRYRQSIDADNVLIFTDLKKKHSSHAITADVSLLETAHAAEFFMTDGIILTGTATGKAADMDDLNSIHGKLKSPIIIGSGVTESNLKNYYSKSDALIIGSYFKKDGKWENELCENAITGFMNSINNLRINSVN